MKPTTVEQYIQNFPPAQQAKLSELRDIIRAALPDTTETLKWNQPAMVEPDGMILVVYAGFKQHMNLVATPSTKQAFDQELTDYETAKGSVKLPYDKPLPADLITRMVQYRAREYRDDRVNWK